MLNWFWTKILNLVVYLEMQATLALGCPSIFEYTDQLERQIQALVAHNHGLARHLYLHDVDAADLYMTVH
jgi:hypothetical protein